MMPQSGRIAVQADRFIRLFVVFLFAVMMNSHGSGREAYGQQPFNAGGWSGGQHVQPFDPELFSDYLLSDQTPHPAVARIIAPESTGVSLGSGVLVDVNGSQGLVLTNWHVIRDSRSAVLVQFADGFQSAGTVIRFDEAWDLAAISIWKPKATPVPLAQRNPIPGEPLSIAGYGRGAYREQRGRCTEYLSPGSGYPKELVELQAPARQGDSGGPILNADGRLAGVLFGEGDGRTVGSCVSRLRVFLASVGSDGFETPPYSVAAGTTHQIQKQPIPLNEQAMPSVQVTQSSQKSPRMYPDNCFITSAANAADGSDALSFGEPAANEPTADFSLVSAGRFTHFRCSEGSFQYIHQYKSIVNCSRRPVSCALWLATYLAKSSAGVIRITHIRQA